ncbi:hypothetical protein OS190_06635 [Sulfitobacter sp. F26204]|uniref:hypothetical protein n=1 Tax=Sulfitobacter sp. F26204 TaxID=2996014 RepID=UPI00225E6C1F|nr:hypothetical protein [Sulfitobacter sp. F26204]MCX7559241.1 hypothetical protein [Sulfitobacter sp. F26204]
MDPNEIIPLIPDEYYDPSDVVLIGSHMAPSPMGDVLKANATAKQREEYTDKLAAGEMHIRCDFADKLILTAKSKDGANSGPGAEDECPTIALIYAYGYEGHNYRLDKPRIMIVEGRGKPYKTDGSNDPSASLTGVLYMWRMSKHHHTISIEVESGELEKLVLEANQPGNRAVNSYGAHMQMSHRGGKH